MLVSGRVELKKKTFWVTTSLKIPKELKRSFDSKKWTFLGHFCLGFRQYTALQQQTAKAPCRQRLVAHRLILQSREPQQLTKVMVSDCWNRQKTVGHVSTSKIRRISSIPKKTQRRHKCFYFFSRELNRFCLETFHGSKIFERILRRRFSFGGLQEEGYQGRRPFFCRGSTSAGFCNVGAGGNTTRQMRFGFPACTFLIRFKTNKKRHAVEDVTSLGCANIPNIMIFNIKFKTWVYYVSLKPYVVVPFCFFKQFFHPWRSMIQKTHEFSSAGKGGETEFASSRVAFEAFPMKAEVENLIGVPVMNQATKGTLMAGSDIRRKK